MLLCWICIAEVKARLLQRRKIKVEWPHRGRRLLLADTEHIDEFHWPPYYGSNQRGSPSLFMNSHMPFIHILLMMIASWAYAAARGTASWAGMYLTVIRSQPYHLYKFFSFFKIFFPLHCLMCWLYNVTAHKVSNNDTTI